MTMAPFRPLPAAGAGPRPDPGIAIPPGCRLATCDLDGEGDGEGGDGIALAEARALLSAAEAARADRFRFARDRDRYVRGRGFLRRQLAAATGRPAAGLALIEGPQGKPALACGAVEFNLSHSGALAVLAISTAGPVGIDVEHIDRMVDVAGLAETCFTAAERAVLDRLDAAARPRQFFLFWTAKEARMKLTGEGMALAPRAIELDLLHDRPLGCRTPAAPRVRFDFPGLGGDGSAVCCLATLAGEGGR